MSASSQLYAAIGDSALLLAVWASVIPAPRRARLPLALVSFGCAWLLSFLLAGLHAPAWALAVSAGAIAISIGMVITAAQLSTRGDSGGGGDSDDGDGGLGRRRPKRPEGGGGPAEPSWWPEFERELRRYISERESVTR